MQIGQKTYTRGIEITITTEPYELYGGTWQDGTDANGKTHTIPTREQRQANAKESQTQWQEQQAGFARLKKLQNS